MPIFITTHLHLKVSHKKREHNSIFRGYNEHAKLYNSFSKIDYCNFYYTTLLFNNGYIYFSLEVMIRVSEEFFVMLYFNHFTTYQTSFAYNCTCFILKST